MGKRIFSGILVLLMLIVREANSQPLIDDRQKFAEIGNLQLESGQQILDCRIGYRTFGKLNDSKSNVVVFLTGLGDYTGRFQFLVPGRYVDTTKYYLILIDALSNGVSSSPSNSNAQPKNRFPLFSIRDMVKGQYILLTEKLNLHHFVAVGGFSMGGMTAFQWAVSYPTMMDKVISIEGTPKTTSYDLLWANILLEAIQQDPAYRAGAYDSIPTLANASRILQTFFTTPEQLNQTVEVEKFHTWLSAIDKQIVTDWNDLIWQLKACIKHDIGANFGGSLLEAAKNIKAKMLIITNKQDHAVNPKPSIEIASALGAKLVLMDSKLGHIILFEKSPIAESQDFLSK